MSHDLLLNASHKQHVPITDRPRNIYASTCLREENVSIDVVLLVTSGFIRTQDDTDLPGWISMPAFFFNQVHIARATKSE